MDRLCRFVCAAIGVLFILGSCNVIDFHICIRAAGKCVKQPKDTP